MGEMSGVADPVIEHRLDGLGEVGRVGHRPGQHQGHPGAVSRRDGQMRPLLRCDPPEPHQLVAARPERPVRGVYPVGNDLDIARNVRP